MAKLIKRAAAAREALIKARPEHTLSRRAMQVMAQNLRARGKPDQAAAVHETLARRFPGQQKHLPAFSRWPGQCRGATRLVKLLENFTP